MRGAPIIAVVFSSTAIAIGVSQYAFGLFIPPIEETFGWSRTEISASLSFAAVGGLAAPLIGRAMDRFGVRPILVFSLCTFGLSFCLRPLISELWHWYALSFLQFVPLAGMSVLPAGKLVANWFPDSRGRMMGVAASGNNFGGLVMPALIAGLLATMAWSGTSVVVGAAALVVAVAAALMVREAPPASNTHPGGLRPTGEHAPRHGTSLRDRDLPDIVRSRMFHAMFVAVTFGMFTYSAVLPHVLPHLLNQGMSNATAVSVFGTFAVGGACGKLLFGWMSERYGARRMLLSNLIGQAVFSALLAVGSDKAVLAVATPMFGLFMGGFGTLYVLLIQEQFGLRHFGSVAGLVNLGSVLPLGLGPLVAGASYDLTGSYGAAFLVTSGLFVAGAASLTFARPRAPHVAARRSR